MTDIHRGRPAVRRSRRLRFLRPVVMLMPLALIAVAILAIAGCGSGGQYGDTVDVTGAPPTAAPEVTADTGGRLQVAEAYFDAGTVKTGELAQHVYELKNAGNGPLYLAGRVSVKKLEGC